jgi:hypothetical protein
MNTNKKNYIFYHIPKTGGSTIYEVTKNWKNFKRADLYNNHVRVAFKPPPKGYIGVAIIRNPYDRFTSAFYHMVDSCSDDFFYKRAIESDCKSLNDMGVYDFGRMYNFDPNVFLILLEEGDKITNKIFNKFSIFRTQYYWISSIFGGIHSRMKLIPYSRMTLEFEQIALRLGETLDWSKSVNKRITNTSIPLTQDSKEIIKRLYKQDFRYLF